jgi:hypothetical protein
MSQIILKHSGGNSVAIAAPDSNPASDRTLKLPSDADGTFLTTNSSVGKILQVVSAHKSDTFSQATSAGTFYDITGLSASITPASSSNKILVLFNINAGFATGWRGSFRLVRDSTAINLGDASGSVNRAAFSAVFTGSSSQTEQVSSNFLDSPSSTSSLTYKLQLVAEGGTHYINRSNSNNTGATYFSGTSNLTLMEVAA